MTRKSPFPILDAFTKPPFGSAVPLSRGELAGSSWPADHTRARRVARLIGRVVLMLLRLSAILALLLSVLAVVAVLAYPFWAYLVETVFGKGGDPVEELGEHLLRVAPLVLFLMVALVVSAMMVNRHRQATQYAVLSALTVAAERGVPLTAALEAFAHDHGGVMRRRALRTADLLDSGTTLCDALTRVPRVVPPQSMPVILAGNSAGALASGLRSALDSHDANESLWHEAAVKVLYLAGLILLAFGAGTYFAWIIVPHLQQIFAEFHRELPSETRITAGTLGFFGTPGLVLLGTGVFCVLVALVFVYAALRYVGWVRWDPPGVKGLARRLDTAAILQSLALAAEHRQSLTEGIAGLVSSYPKKSIRDQLTRVLADLRNGADWCESMQTHGLIRQADFAVLQAAARAGNLPWALREMADSNRRRLAYGLEWALQGLYPLAIVAFGFLTLALVRAYLVPL
ncbi:MAG: type II secretion system F family protein, partial [Planctomycetota bacterium]